jgi:hypothetical protein
MPTKKLIYAFSCAGCEPEVLSLEFDAQSIELVANTLDTPPDWALLEHCRCPHCSLDSGRHRYCPLAAAIAGVVHRFAGILSHDQIFLQVTSEERIVSQTTTAQRALSSFMGVVMAVSGCPHTAFFKPMARFHLPLASEEETIYRSTSMYLLAQYFRARQGFEVDLSLTGLEKIYRDLQIVNTALVDRLRKASKADSSANAVIMLDMYARIMPYVIADKLEDIRHLFAEYL